jgi:hypothetical protein
MKLAGSEIKTKMGWVVTRTTELATEVYFREAIQKAKWRLRKRPERRNHPISFLSHPLHVFL